MGRKVIDGDTGETVELTNELHCFIVRFDDDQFEAVLRHQERLGRVCGAPVSRAATVREIVAQVLPRRRKRTIGANQLTLWSERARDPRLAGDVARARRAIDAQICGASRGKSGEK